MSIQQEKFKEIADVIREKTNSTEKIKPIEFASKVDEVYEAGKAKGIEEGEQAEVKRFWDIMQNEGERVSYYYQFCGSGWKDSTFTPQYDFALKSDNSRMFYQSRITDLKGVLERLGRTFDTSKANNLSYFYEESSITKSPLIDTSGLKQVERVFYNASAMQEAALKLKDDGTQTFVGVFSRCTSLVDLEIQGTIGQNGFNVSPCTKLTSESVLSVLDHLKSGVSGLTVTLGATNQGKVSPEKIAEAQAKGWTIA